MKKIISRLCFFQLDLNLTTNKVLNCYTVRSVQAQKKNLALCVVEFLYSSLSKNGEAMVFPSTQLHSDFDSNIILFTADRQDPYRRREALSVLTKIRKLIFWTSNGAFASILVSFVKEQQTVDGTPNSVINCSFLFAFDCKLAMTGLISS